MEFIFITDNQNRSLRKKIETKLKINDLLAMILGLFGVILEYEEYELFYGDVKLDTDSSGNSIFTGTDDQYVETTTITVLRIIIGISSFLLALTIFNHYRLRLHFYKAKQKVDSYDTLKSSGLLIPMICEMVYCMIFCPPGFNWVFTFEQLGGYVDYAFDMLVLIVMLGRVYLIWRIAANYSSWNDEKAEEICNSCLCEGGVNFAIKAELKERPYTVVSIVLLLSILTFGVALRTAERPFMKVSLKNWDYMWNGMWCIVITMTTVGYGDFFPSTHLGRLIDVIACFWGTFLVSLMVVSLTISSEFTPQERKAYDKIKRDESEEDIKVKAINAIKCAIKLRIFLKKNPYASEKQKARLTNKFKNALIEYRTNKRNLVASEQDAPIEYILAKLNDKVSFGLERIKNDCHVYKTLLARLDSAEINQVSLQNDIKTLEALNSRVLSKLEMIKKLQDDPEPKKAF
ncbi:unnamed protein product [Blepharisma stoltei]|uniref:Potassium channel domain-containing protein n=1 Tax=Blepharisma stoltei TaxID=1481888 RepID=A0AAU9IJD5_9CILI|nr:unnamed protein product [Blepharisma stoltei]